MLIEFQVENFKSIKQKRTFSMVATQDKEHPKHLITNPGLKKDMLLKTAAIYGANASGKSNLIQALQHLQQIIKDSHEYQSASKLPYAPFKLDKKTQKEPTSFKVIFIVGDIKYMYSVSLTNERVLEENLFYYPEGRKATIFKRNKNNKYTFTFDIKNQKFIADKTPENVLYLSRATQLNNKFTKPAFSWFADFLRIITATENPGLTDYTARIIGDKKLKENILNAITKADMGINDILATKKKWVEEEFPPDMPKELREVLVKYSGEDMKIQFHHGKVLFDFEEESEGTKRLFSLMGPWLDCLRNGRILVVDELDTKLHHTLSLLLLQAFHDSAQNAKNAQLVFATHNLKLLDLDIFRRDQIWFTEKNPEDMATDLYSLIEYGVRKDKDILAGYLAGKYGGLPFIKHSNLF